MPDSRVAALLRKKGVGTPRLSERAAAGRCGVSDETIRKLMRGGTQLISDSVLDKIAEGLGIPRGLLRHENLVDAGYIQATSGSSVAEALAQIHGLSDHDRALVLIELLRMQQEQAIADQEMRNASASTE